MVDEGLVNPISRAFSQHQACLKISQSFCCHPPRIIIILTILVLVFIQEKKIHSSLCFLDTWPSWHRNLHMYELATRKWGLSANLWISSSSKWLLRWNCLACPSTSRWPWDVMFKIWACQSGMMHDWTNGAETRLRVWKQRLTIFFAQRKKNYSKITCKIGMKRMNWSSFVAKTSPIKAKVFSLFSCICFSATFPRDGGQFGFAIT